MTTRLFGVAALALMCVAVDVDAQTISSRRDMPSISEVAARSTAVQREFLRRGINTTEISSEMGVARARQTVSVTVEADGGGYIYAVCDDACSGLSIKVSVDNEEKTASGQMPYIEYSSGVSKYFHVEVTMRNCSEPACRFSVGVLRR